MKLTLTEAPIPSLRPYQQSAIVHTRAAIAGGKKRILLTAPTGSGKMVVIAAIIRTSTVPVLFVCHRLELVEQCVDQLARQGITHVGVLRGDDDRENPSASVQVASIQTLARRKKPPAGLVIIDESHRAMADTYRDLFDHYKDAIILGFTASPCRQDGKPLGVLFEELIVVATYSELFKRPDWLVGPDSYSAPVRADLSDVPKSHGDFEETALGEVMSQERLVGNLLEHWLKLASRHPVETVKGTEYVDGERRRTFIFAVNIAHSRAICDRFSKAGIRIAHLDGTTPENERRAMLSDLRAGKLECVSNCNVLLEGVDAPEVKCVVHARPTWSLVLWLQSCGRIFRPWNSVRPLILDHADNWERHGPPHADRIWSLKDVAERRDKRVAPTKICKACFAYISLGTWVCPYCKYVFTQAEMQIPTESHETLVMLRSYAPEVVRREFFDKMAALARVKGYKPGFASVKHKELYGDWPPREWSEVVRARFASDPMWQKMVEVRVKRKTEEEAAWGGDMGAAVEAELAQKYWPSAKETSEVQQADAAAHAISRSVHGASHQMVDTVPPSRRAEAPKSAPLSFAYDDGEETFAAWTERMGCR